MYADYLNRLIYNVVDDYEYGCKINNFTLKINNKYI